MNFEVIDGTAAIPPEHTRGVRVVNHHDRAISFSEIAQCGQRADVAIHREDTIADQQLVTRLIFH